MIPLYLRHVLWRQFAFAGEQVTDALRAVAIQPFVRNIVGIVIVHHAVICRDNEMLLRVIGLRQLIKGDKTRPFILACPTRRGQEILPFCANGYGAGHHIANIPLIIGIYQILWWNIPVTQSLFELFPVRCAVEFIERRNDLALLQTSPP